MQNATHMFVFVFLLIQEDVSRKKVCKFVEDRSLERNGVYVGLE